MKTILVPVDFSSSIDKTLRFVSSWAHDYGYGRIILLKSSNQTIFEQAVLSVDYMIMKQRYFSEAQAQLDTKARTLTNFLEGGPAQVKVYTSLNEQPLLRSILEIIDNESPELIITGSSRPEEVIAIAKASPIPVLIVPPSHSYLPVEEALVPVDLGKIDHLGRFDIYQDSAFFKKTRLLVLNIDPAGNHIKHDEHFTNSERSMHEYLKHFQHEIFYSDNPEIIKGIREFAIQHPVQLIIALPGRHSFLYRLTHKSISEAIYRNDQIPVLILK